MVPWYTLGQSSQPLRTTGTPHWTQSTSQKGHLLSFHLIIYYRKKKNPSNFSVEKNSERSQCVKMLLTLWIPFWNLSNILYESCVDVCTLKHANSARYCTTLPFLYRMASGLRITGLDKMLFAPILFPQCSTVFIPVDQAFSQEIMKYYIVHSKSNRECSYSHNQPHCTCLNSLLQTKKHVEKFLTEKEQ